MSCNSKVKSNIVEDFYPFTAAQTEAMRLERKWRILAGNKQSTRYHESSRANEARKEYIDKDSK